ncbi:MAG: NAD(P)-dependent oxidoreductase [Pseudonocardiaceae bacterium]
MPPTDPVVSELCILCSELLKLDEIGATDDFLELGADSLLILRMINRIQARFGTRLTLREAFQGRNRLGATPAPNRGASVPLPIAVLPGRTPQQLVTAISEAGGRLVAVDRAEGLIWLGERASELGGVLSGAPTVRWVQLAGVGVESYLPLMDAGRQWTCARGVYAQPVAEHALLLALACLRGATVSARARAWWPQPAISLAGAEVVIVGGGSIARALLRLLEPFQVRATVVRRTDTPIPDLTVSPVEAIDQLLPRARVVFLAAPLTVSTNGLIDLRRLWSMRSDACLVNVSRGQLIVTEDLVHALRNNWIAGAGLDVTHPEPLPQGHPLWDLPNCLITAHSAGDLERSMNAFVDLVRRNVRRLVDGLQPHGLVDLDAGY